MLATDAHGRASERREHVRRRDDRARDQRRNRPARAYRAEKGTAGKREYRPRDGSGLRTLEGGGSRFPVDDRQPEAPSTPRSSNLPIERMRAGLHYLRQVFRPGARGSRPAMATTRVSLSRSSARPTRCSAESIESAIAILKLKQQHRSGRRSTSKALHDGDAIVSCAGGARDRGTIRPFCPPRDALSRRACPAHTSRHQHAARRRRRRSQADHVLSGTPRSLAGADWRWVRRAHCRRHWRVYRCASVVVGQRGDRHRPARIDRGIRWRHDQGVAEIPRAQGPDDSACR